MGTFHQRTCRYLVIIDLTNFSPSFPQLLDDSLLYSLLPVTPSDQQPVPVKVYQNADINKEEIFIDNKGLSGIYCFTNLINKKQYVGCAVDIRKRMYQHYSAKRLMVSAAQGSIISKALLKYGYSAFSLEILEYCDAKDLIERESYYITLLKPEYNILPEGFTRLGTKHTEETLHLEKK
jgi:hypothetical protein